MRDVDDEILADAFQSLQFRPLAPHFFDHALHLDGSFLKFIPQQTELVAALKGQRGLEMAGSEVACVVDESAEAPGNVPGEQRGEQNCGDKGDAGRDGLKIAGGKV